MALVSIITPAYNCKNTIKETYDSVLSQAFTDWEWIIVDDCSKDDSFSFIKELAKNEPRIVVLQTPKNGGSSVARNIGLKHATGRYITFLDSDDTIDNNYLKSQVEFITDNGPLITAGYRRDRNGIITTFIPRDEITFKKALKGNDMSCLTTMFDRTVFGKMRFHEDFQRDEDYVFWLEILKKGVSCKTNKQVLATYYLHKNSKNSEKKKLFKSRYNVYHKVLGYNFVKSLWLMLNYFLYGRKKYKNV